MTTPPIERLQAAVAAAQALLPEFGVSVIAAAENGDARARMLTAIRLNGAHPATIAESLCNALARLIYDHVSPDGHEKILAQIHAGIDRALETVKNWEGENIDQPPETMQ